MNMTSSYPKIPFLIRLKMAIWILFIGYPTIYSSSQVTAGVQRMRGKSYCLGEYSVYVEYLERH